ncbi:MAG: hypothetical protein ACP5GY_07410, partial [Vulcanisaeta sp.]
MIEGINVKTIILMIIIALIIIDAYLIYTYLSAPPLPYTKVLGYYGDYDIANVYKDVVMLYEITFSIKLRGINMTNDRYIWSSTINVPGLLPLTRFIRIDDKILVMTYNLYRDKIVANVTVLNIFTGKIINYTVLVAASSYKYYMAADAINDNVYVIIIPLRPLKAVNATIIDFKLLSGEPFGVETWRSEISNFCIPFSLAVTGIKKFNNYVLITVSCGNGSFTYVLNAYNGKLMLKDEIGSEVYGIVGNTLIYQCLTGVCGLNFVSNKTWALPVIGNVASLAIYGNETIVLTTTGNAIWVYGVLSNGTLLFRKDLWTYSIPLILCSGGFKYAFTAKPYLIGNDVLILVMPGGIWMWGFLGCMPQSIILLNPANGHVLLSVTKLAWIVNSPPHTYMGPTLEINYLSNDHIVYSVNTIDIGPSPHTHK